MDDPLSGMSRHTLIARALEEDHAAIRATTQEACLAHYALAGLMRQKADELLDAGRT